MTLEHHPAAAAFPMLGDEELRDLADDIKAHGLVEPIILLNGKILDGRNRYAACVLAKVEPRFEDWNGRAGSPLDFIVAENLHRRHLNAGQRAMIAKELLPFYEAEAKGRQGERTDIRTQMSEGHAGANKTDAGRARDHAAKVVNVSGSYVDKARRLSVEEPELAKEVLAGDRTLSSADRESRKPASERRPYVSRSRRQDKVIEAAGHIVRLAERWTTDDCYALTPKEARKQLTVLRKAITFLEDQVVPAVEYRAATLHTSYTGR